MISSQQTVKCSRTYVFFSRNIGVGKKGYQIPRELVLQKFYNWKRAFAEKGYFKLHFDSDHHKICQYRHDHFW